MVSLKQSEVFSHRALQYWDRSQWIQTQLQGCHQAQRFVCHKKNVEGTFRWCMTSPIQVLLIIASKIFFKSNLPRSNYFFAPPPTKSKSEAISRALEEACSAWISLYFASFMWNTCYMAENLMWKFENAHHEGYTLPEREYTLPLSSS